MRLLPFMDIPVIKDKVPSAGDRLKQLVEWAEGDRSKLSVGFLAYENNGDEPEDYLFQIAFIKDNCIVTNSEVIEETGNYCNEYSKWKEQTKLVFEVRAHIELYYNKIGKVAPWGSHKYQKLKDSRSVRILYGPHKGGNLRPNEKRMIILDEKNEIVYGPRLA